MIKKDYCHCSILRQSRPHSNSTFVEVRRLPFCHISDDFTRRGDFSKLNIVLIMSMVHCFVHSFATSIVEGRHMASLRGIVHIYPTPPWMLGCADSNQSHCRFWIMITLTYIHQCQRLGGPNFWMFRLVDGKALHAWVPLPLIYWRPIVKKTFSIFNYSTKGS